MKKRTYSPMKDIYSTMRELLLMVIPILLVAGISAALGHSKAWSEEPKKVVALVNGDSCLLSGRRPFRHGWQNRKGMQRSRYSPDDVVRGHISVGYAYRMIRSIGIIFLMVSSIPLSVACTQQKESRPGDAGYYYVRGNDYYRQGMYDQAIAAYSKAIEINPMHAEAYANRGNAHGQKGQYDEAISDFDKAIGIDPGNAQAYYNRGNAFCRKGLYAQAISDFSKALELNPGDAGLYYNRGNAYARRGGYDQAISDYIKALEINPRYALAYYNRGRTFYLMKKYHESRQDVKHAQDLGYKVPVEFLGALQKATEKQK